MHKLDSSESFNDIIAKADKLYNGQINLYDVGDRKPENIFDEMKEWIEFRGKNPITEFGMMGPHKRVNELYGSFIKAWKHYRCLCASWSRKDPVLHGLLNKN